MCTDPSVAEVHVEFAERPDDSPLRCAFEPLSEKDLAQRLTTLAKPERTVFDAARGRLADAIAFQPCLRYSSQDRFVVRQLDVHGQKWTFTGVFDGHLGDATVEHTAYHLPIIVKESLQKVITGPAAPAPEPDLMRDILSNAITAFDDCHRGGRAGAIPGRDRKARLCLYGTTALVALVDPAHENLWVANLGDCEAVLITPGADGRLSRHEVLNVLHNGTNPAEVARVRRDHPDEPESVQHGRVLGTIAPFRCIGDAPFKQPAIFTRRVLYNLYPGVPDPTPWETFLARNRTPPYISSVPDVVHRRLPPRSAGTGAGRSFLVLATDGLSELYDGTTRAEMAADWARCVAEAASSKGENLALRLLRRALGGEDLMSISQMVTLDMDTPWMDDTTIIVQAL
ncbi:phosphatase 2C-like domain-containing protein [Lactarius hatsudake]|nr:phosphatase 2C-like domain-containing protein [Lactarius hatsudake]